MIKIKGASKIEEKNTKELHHVGELFRQLHNKVNRVEKKKRIYKQFEDLTINEIDTIIAIGCENGKRMSEIAKILDISFGSSTIAINRLVKKGVVERFSNEEDRRHVFVKLSEKGSSIYKLVTELNRRYEENIFGILEPEERSTLISIYNKLNRKIDDVFYKHNF